MADGTIKGNLKPLSDRVVVKVDNTDEEQTKSGLIMPESVKEKKLTGVVLSVGPGRRAKTGELIPVSIKVGDKVYFDKFAGVETKLNDQDVLILHEDEIYGVVE